MQKLSGPEQYFAMQMFLHWVTDGEPLTSVEERELHGEPQLEAEALPLAA